MLTDFKNFLTSRLGIKFVTKWLLTIPPQLKQVAVLPFEIQMGQYLAELWTWVPGYLVFWATTSCSCKGSVNFFLYFWRLVSRWILNIHHDIVPVCFIWLLQVALLYSFKQCAVLDKTIAKKVNHTTFGFCLTSLFFYGDRSWFPKGLPQKNHRQLLVRDYSWFRCPFCDPTGKSIDGKGQHSEWN